MNVQNKKKKEREQTSGHITTPMGKREEEEEQKVKVRESLGVGGEQGKASGARDEKSKYDACMCRIPIGIRVLDCSAP